MEKVFIFIRQDKYISDIGNKINFTAKVHIYFKLVNTLKEIYFKEKNKEKEFIFMPMELNIKVIGKLIKSMDMESITINN